MDCVVNGWKKKKKKHAEAMEEFDTETCLDLWLHLLRWSVSL